MPGGGAGFAVKRLVDQEEMRTAVVGDSEAEWQHLRRWVAFVRGFDGVAGAESAKPRKHGRSRHRGVEDSAPATRFVYSPVFPISLSSITI
jgi:hypothetical protein